MAQLNRHMPYTYGDAVLAEDDIDPAVQADAPLPVRRGLSVWSETAVIWGNDASTQAAQIIGNVAHPSVRDELREAGSDLGFRLC